MNVRSQLLMVGVLATGVASCQGIPPRVILPVVEERLEPALSESCEVALGEVLMARARLHTFDAIELLEEASAGDGFLLKRLRIEPAFLPAKGEDDKYIYYYADPLLVYDGLIGEMEQTGGLKLPKDGVPTKVGRGKERPNPSIFMGNNLASIYMGKMPKFRHCRVQAMNGGSFRQEIKYSGRVGEVLRFVYREFSEDMNRPTVDQELQHDLSVGELVVIQGAKFKVSEATNQHIAYEVLAHFPNREPLIQKSLIEIHP